MLNAEAALQDAALEAERYRAESSQRSGGRGRTLVVNPPGPAVGVFVSILAIADVIKSEAARRGMSRKRYVEWMTRRVAQVGG